MLAESWTKEKDWTTRDGYRGLVYRVKYGAYCSTLGAGHRCGYVVLPSSHPCHNKHYDAISVGVHGGLTYAEVDNDDKSAWRVGFCCAHYGDSETIWDTEAVVAEVESLSRQLKAKEA